MLENIWLIIWKICKYLQRKFIFGTHEVFRICAHSNVNTPSSIIRALLKQPQPPAQFSSDLVYALDRSLMYSTQLTIARRQIEGSDCVDLKPIFNAIVERKFPSIGSFEREKKNLQDALIVIRDINQFLHHVNIKASTKYDSTIKAHEQKLYQIHQNLLNKMPSQRITKEWQLLGFQGNDPSTDFRGMGKLALDELAHFSRLPLGKSTWSESGGDDGYSWAICGIQITAYQLQLLRSRKLQRLLFNWHFKATEKAGKNADLTEDLTIEYYDMYAWMFDEYHKFWKIFIEGKQEYYRVKGLKLVPVLLHNEFFLAYKRRIECILLSGGYS